MNIRPNLARFALLALAMVLLAFGNPVLAQVAGPPPATAAPPEIPLDIREGLTLSAELRGGESRAYKFSSSKDEFVNAVIDQQGIDVEVRLVAPSGKEVAWIDSFNGSHGIEPIAAVLPETGIYHLQVVSGNPKAAAGRYELKILVLHPATSEDRQFAAAQKSHAAAIRLLNENTAVSRRAAIEQWRAALDVFTPALGGEHYSRAMMLYGIALAHAHSSEFHSALETLPKALQLFREAHDAGMQAQILTLMGGSYDVLGDLPQARAIYQQALDLARSVHASATEASVLNNLGKIYHDQGEWQNALDYYQQALPLFHALGDRRREAILLNNIGVVYDRLGDPQTALTYLQQTLPLRRAIADKAGEADTLKNIGYAHALLGQNELALQSYRDALGLQSAVGDKRTEAGTLDYVGRMYADSGHPDLALDSAQRSLEFRRATHDRRGEALSLANTGNADLLLQRPQPAVEAEQQALAIYRSIGDRRGIVEALELEARAERDLGQLTAARAHIEEALALVEEQRQRVSGQDLRVSYFALSHDSYSFYIELLMQMHQQDPSQGFDRQALEASERARARGLLELLTEARVDIQQGVSPELAAEEQKIEQALAVKSERLTQSLGRSQGSPELEQLKSEAADLERRSQQIRANIRKSSPQYAAVTQPHTLNISEIQHQVLDRDTVLLEYWLGERASYAWTLDGDGLHSFQLAPRREIEDAAREIYAMITTRPAPRGPAAAAQWRDRTQRLSRMVLAPVVAAIRGKRLLLVPDGGLQYMPFAMLPLPDGKSADAKSGGDKSAAARPAGGVPLITQHEIVTLPSASILAAQRAQLAGRQPATHELAVLADPVFNVGDVRVQSDANRSAVSAPVTPSRGEGDAARILFHPAARHPNGSVSTVTAFIPRLPFTRKEAQEILAVSSGAGNLSALDFQASRATVVSNQLSQYRYVHFATHGYLDSDQPELSAIVLSLVDERGHAEDGFLRVHDIYNLKLPAEVVVLSACETGLGKEIKGEGLVGLTRGFMYAGAARVVVSLWSVSDKATAELMAAFYARLLKQHQRPAAALRAAQLQMIGKKQWDAPYYWAGFIIQGDWN